jgi:hypothetical protein
LQSLQRDFLPESDASTSYRLKHWGQLKTTVPLAAPEATIGGEAGTDTPAAYTVAARSPGDRDEAAACGRAVDESRPDLDSPTEDARGASGIRKVLPQSLQRDLLPASDASTSYRLPQPGQSSTIFIAASELRVHTRGERRIASGTTVRKR